MASEPIHSLISTYAPAPVTFVRGKNATLYSSEGKDYIDFLAGIAVISAGHCNEDVTKAVSEQLNRLVHVSNLFWTEPMACLSEELKRITGDWGKVFFANSGAEANECAIKLAVKAAGPERHKVICAFDSFHGRTLATLAATGQPTKWEPFQPLPQGFVHAPYNDLDAFAALVDKQTAAIFVEPIQGEGGIIPGDLEFLRGLRELCDNSQIALIFDEVQTGIGRTGNWWAFQHYGVQPDIFTSAKGIANGLPLGACIANDKFASAFSPGDHGSTYGGGPVVTTAALATILHLERNNVLAQIPSKSKILREALLALPSVVEVRGLGLMLAAVLNDSNAKQIASRAIEQGLIVNAVRENVIRLTPPLTISDEEIELGLQRLKKAVSAEAN